MLAIARACRERTIAGRVGLVISDQADAPGIALARDMAIEARTVTQSAGDRAAFEQALAETIESADPDLVILAGFMRVLSAPFVARYAGRMLNIHPSLLPKYPGLHTHRRVLAAGDREHGATVHFVTEKLDAGPLILQSRVPVLADDTEDSLSARVQAIEHTIYPKAVGWIADGRLRWNAGRPTLDGRILEQPVVEDVRGG